MKRTKQFNFLEIVLMFSIVAESMVAQYPLAKSDGKTSSRLNQLIENLTPEEKYEIENNIDTLLPVARKYLHDNGIKSRNSDELQISEKTCCCDPNGGCSNCLKEGHECVATQDTEIEDLDGVTTVLKCGECVEKGSDGASCFHGSNNVILENGEKRLISDLKPEDSVLVMNDEGSLHFSPVILQMHESPKQKSEFRIIRTSMGHNLTLTPTHLIYTRNYGEESSQPREFHSIQAVFASNVQIGDYVLVKDGTNGMKADKVVAVDTISSTGV